MTGRDLIIYILSKLFASLAIAVMSLKTDIKKT